MKVKKLAAMIGAAWIGLGSYAAIGACQGMAASVQAETGKNAILNDIILSANELAFPWCWCRRTVCTYSS